MRAELVRPVAGAGCEVESWNSKDECAQARGTELSEHNDKDSSASESARSRSRRSRKRGGARSKAGDVGKALRSVYDSTLREDVPGDFLDLLGKLH